MRPQTEEPVGHGPAGVAGSHKSLSFPFLDKIHAHCHGIVGLAAGVAGRFVSHLEDFRGMDQLHPRVRGVVRQQGLNSFFLPHQEDLRI